MSSEVEAIARMVTGAQLVPMILKDERGVEHAFHPTGNGAWTRIEITPKGEIEPKPAFIDQIVNIDMAGSLIEYVNRFKTDETVIFADIEEKTITAAIDFHQKGSSGAGFVEHRAVLSLSFSHEWDTWMSVNKRMYDQKAFAKLLDVNSEDIAQPTAAELLEQVLDLEMAKSVTVQRKLARSGSGRGEGGVTTRVDGTVLPAFFVLSIPVFTGEGKVDVRAMTLDDIDGNSGKISLGLELVRTRIIVEQELARITKAIADATSVPMIMGSIE